jgi:hypothetical protein
VTMAASFEGVGAASGTLQPMRRCCAMRAATPL